MTKKYFLSAMLVFSLLTFGQVTYNGNGNTGFGGPVGTSNLQVNDDGTTITFTLTKGSNDFNDAMVIYFSTGAPGRTAIDSDVNDQGDNLRRAISSAGSDASTINFVSGFEATHAMAISVNSSTNFAGLWSIPATGVISDNGLPFVSSANLPAGTTPTFTSITLSITWADLGLVNTDDFDFVATYLNSGNGFTSDEGYGAGLPTGNPGAGTVTFTGFDTYSNALNTGSATFENVNVFTSNGSLNITGLNTMADVFVYNLLGQSVFQRQNTFIDDNTSLNLTSNAKGIYLVKIVSEGKSKTAKILIK
jgi:hypothetical protein